MNNAALISNKNIPLSSNLVQSMLLQLCYKTCPVPKWYCMTRTFEVVNCAFIREMAKLFLKFAFYARAKTCVWAKQVLNISTQHL